MPLTLPEQITMEKTPSYFVTEEVPARIRSTLPDARLLVVVRDPVTRALSDYAQTASKRPDSTLPFEVLAFRRRRRRRDGDSTSNFRHQPNRRRRTTRGGNGTSSAGRNVDFKEVLAIRARIQQLLATAHAKVLEGPSSGG
ncbi:hypothetical protein MTO96_024316 [Rhipicephalus appendiculatus]